MRKQTGNVSSALTTFEVVKNRAKSRDS